MFGNKINIEFLSYSMLGNFLFTTEFRTALGPTQPPTQWVGIKRPEREADHSSPSSAEVRQCVELYLHSLNMPSWRGAQLKHRENFNLPLYSLIRAVIAHPV
jgi:hypothetical protein